MPEKKFKCEYYQVTQSVRTERENLFDLEAWIALLETLNLNERTHPYNDDTVRLEEYYLNPDNGLWFLRFMRQRPNDVPSFSGSNTASRFMELEDDQFVSEDVTCLFDTTNNVLMIQKNSHSVTPVGIEQYFNQTTPNDVAVNLRKVVATDSFEKVRGARKCRKIQIRLADLRVAQNLGMLNRMRSSIGNMVQSMNNVPSPYLELTFSVGMGRDEEVEEEEFNNVVHDIENMPMAFDKARITILEENETKSEIVDLFLDSPKEEIVFNTVRNNPIRFDALMSAMTQKYCPGEYNDNRKAQIDLYLANR